MTDHLPEERITDLIRKAAAAMGVSESDLRAYTEGILEPLREQRGRKTGAWKIRVGRGLHRRLGGEYAVGDLIEVVPLSALQSQRQLTEEAEAARDTAWFHVRALLQIRIPPRNEPGLDDAVVRAAREALPK